MTSGAVAPAPFPHVDGSQPCARSDPDAWFPIKGESPRLARELCRGCQFVRPCLAYALTHNVQGIWGATTEQQRRALRRKHGLTAVAIAWSPPVRHPSQDADLALAEGEPA